ncbi:MAG: hypothetical protein HYW47_06345, partial [Deltaproteobacteria bacterium]|nr:hypothetical protein [Deltaproteobacteria bacterium]
VARRLEESNEKLRKTQRQLINSEKLAALGVFSSGLAHEIGNPITSISALVQLMNRDVRKAYQDGTSEHLEKKCNLVLEQVERVSHILDKMRELTHSKILVKEKIEIVSVLEDALERIKMEMHSSNVKILTHVQEKDLFVFVLRTQLRQVFSNILLNAFDSMGKEGNLNINVFREDNKVVISFQDSGCGIEGEEPERVLEPFYTTKMKKGLGLSVSYSIIQSFGGDIAIQSKKNHGTTVTVKLPVVKGG